MKRNTFLISLVFSISSFGQTHFIGINSGLTWSNVNTQDLFDDTKKREAYTGDLFYQYLLEKKLYIKSGFSYDQRGFVINSELYDRDGNSIDSSPIQFYYEYLSFPIQIGYQIGKKVYTFGSVGLLTSYLNSAKTKSPSISENENSIKYETYDVKERVTKLDFGGVVELGMGFAFNEIYHIFSSISYNRSFNSITNSKYFSGVKIQHYGYNILFGLKYKLSI